MAKNLSMASHSGNPDLTLQLPGTGQGCASVVECMPCMLVALGSTPAPKLTLAAAVQALSRKRTKSNSNILDCFPQKTGVLRIVTGRLSVASESSQAVGLIPSSHHQGLILKDLGTKLSQPSLSRGSKSENTTDLRVCRDLGWLCWHWPPIDFSSCSYS